MEGQGGGIDNEPSLHKIDRGFDLKAVRSLVRKLDNPGLWKNGNEAKKTLYELWEKRPTLASGLDNKASIGVTLKSFRHLQTFDYNRYLPDYAVEEARADVDRLVLDNIPAIDRAVEISANPADLQLSIDLVTGVLNAGELSQDRRETNFLLKHFEEGLRSDDSEDEKEPGYTKYHLIASKMFLKMDENQRARAMEMFQAMIDNPEIGKQAVYVINVLSGDQMIPDNAREEIRRTLTKPIINKLGLDYDELTKAWISGSDEIIGNYFYHTRNLNQIFILESTNPGICRTLKDEFGITNFDRYPRELLVDLFEQRNSTNTPYGLMFYPKRDHSGAAYLSKSVVGKFYKQLKSLGYGLRLYEVGSKIDLARAFITSQNKFGTRNKIDFVILVGHGNPQSITFGETGKNAEAGEEINDHNVKGIIHQLDFEGKGVQRIGELLSNNANIILVSCSTGAAEGIGKTISETYPGTLVTAPETPTDLRGIDVTKDDQGKLRFRVAYRSADTSRSFESGKSV